MPLSTTNHRKKFVGRESMPLSNTKQLAGSVCGASVSWSMPADRRLTHAGNSMVRAHENYQSLQTTP
eukprot:1157863-Pelagomonas_calceolata.AAC.6